MIAPCEGTLQTDGRPVVPNAPGEATRPGITTACQETGLVRQLTVAQDIVLGRERVFDSVRWERSAARQVPQRPNFNFDPSPPAGALPAARRQMPQIARAVLNDARVILPDEPTASQTPQETTHRVGPMKSLRKRGAAMIFLGHAMEEALTHADRIPVLRNSRLVTTGPAGDFDRARRILHMNGEDPAAPAAAPGRRRAAGPVLQVEHIRIGSMVNTSPSRSVPARSPASPASSGPAAAGWPA